MPLKLEPIKTLDITVDDIMGDVAPIKVIDDSQQ